MRWIWYEIVLLLLRIAKFDPSGVSRRYSYAIKRKGGNKAKIGYYHGIEVVKANL